MATSFETHSGLAPAVAELLDVRDLIGLECLPEALEPRIAGLPISLGPRDDHDELADGVVHRGADRT
ncbi:MAG: hypothetical protein NTU62_17210 [Spirochaetes bacterium]|nr:hypothetical protein [Spirochaetota bacterium]